jgi:hypothetical protein
MAIWSLNEALTLLLVGRLARASRGSSEMNAAVGKTKGLSDPRKFS